MLVFICCIMFLPSYKSKAKLISKYDMDNIKWEKTYQYDFISTVTQGVPYFINGMISGIKGDDNNLLEVIDVTKKEESEKTYYFLSIKSDELLKQDVEKRRNEQKSSYAKRKNVTSWVIFVNRKIDNDLYGIRDLTEELKKEYADERMEEQKQMVNIFLPEIESGNILGLNIFIKGINKNISEEKFNQYTSDYLVGNYEYNEENINKMCELKSKVGVAEYYYNNSGYSAYTYWEECFGLVLFDFGAGLMFFISLIALICRELTLIISLIKTLITKEIVTLKLFDRSVKMGTIFLVVLLPILSIAFNKTMGTKTFGVQFWFNGYTVFGIIAVFCAIGISVVSIMHNQILKKMKVEIDQRINNIANSVE